MKKFLIFILIISLIIFVFWGIPMLKCEYLTARYGNEFDLGQVTEEHSMLDTVEWFKILSYNDEISDIYYIEKDFSTGNILTFKKFLANGNMIAGTLFGLPVAMQMKPSGHISGIT